MLDSAKKGLVCCRIKLIFQSFCIPLASGPVSFETLHPTFTTKGKALQTFTPTFKSHVISDVGQKRKANEDAYLIDKSIGLYVVCDGMGGHAAGEVASDIATKTVHQEIKAALSTTQLALHTEDGRQKMRKLIEECILEASQAIYQHAQENPQKRGMGTTITLCLIQETKAFVGHVGDSRCYLVRSGKTYQITEDHTLLSELIKVGNLSDEDIKDFAYPNALSRALGVQPSVKVDVLEIDLLPDDTFMLCSDGLHGYLDKSNINLAAVLTDTPLETATQKMIDFANRQGGSDNITCMILGVRQAQETERTQRIRSSLTALQGLQLFQGLDYKEYVRLFSICHVKDVPANQWIIEEGQPGNSLHVVIEGQLYVSREGVRIANLQPGQHFGEMSLIDHAPRSASVASETDCSLLSIERDAFEELIKQEPQLGTKLMGNLLKALSQIVRSLSGRLIQQVHTPAPPSIGGDIAQQYGDTIEINSFTMLHNKKQSS
ncbi:MAG: protein phosphatase [Deltaproteobacteria bacterium]|nr:protein phosphatase [Deltaproteobacteria bacterium]MBU53894.1 protein phosphatase [Deltaproteobacteria bacterium]